MDISAVLEAVLKLMVRYFGIKFKVFGYTFSVGSVFIWSGLISIIIWFIRKLDI